VINAINDALRPLGVEIDQTPATAERILEKVIAAQEVRA
jgi:carbon-monoxide dehydrogenase large subunit